MTANSLRVAENRGASYEIWAALSALTVASLAAALADAMWFLFTKRVITTPNRWCFVLLRWLPLVGWQAIDAQLFPVPPLLLLPLPLLLACNAVYFGFISSDCNDWFKSRLRLVPCVRVWLAVYIFQCLAELIVWFALLVPRVVPTPIKLKIPGSSFFSFTVHFDLYKCVIIIMIPFARFINWRHWHRGNDRGDGYFIEYLF